MHCSNLARTSQTRSPCYQKAIELGQTNVFVYLGLGWTQQQAGNTNAARDNYRIALKLSLKYKPHLEWLGDLDVTREAAEYLIAITDAREYPYDWRDAQEAISSARDRGMLPVTPILLPLTSNQFRLRDLVDWNARVAFNLDACAVDSWQWITTNAAWLVYQSKPGEPITSGIQMFGNVTFWMFWRNGHHALSALDDDGNGYLDGSELDHLSI